MNRMNETKRNKRKKKIKNRMKSKNFGSGKQHRIKSIDLIILSLDNNNNL